MEIASNKKPFWTEITLTKESSTEDRKMVYDRILALRGKIKWSLRGVWCVAKLNTQEKD